MSAYEGNVLANINRKERDHDKMIAELCKLTKGWLDETTSIKSNYSYDNKQDYLGIELPIWLNK